MVCMCGNTAPRASSCLFWLVHRVPCLSRPNLLLTPALFPLPLVHPPPPGIVQVVRLLKTMSAAVLRYGRVNAQPMQVGTLCVRTCLRIRVWVC